MISLYQQFSGRICGVCSTVTAGLAALHLQDWVLIIGLIISLITFIVNLRIQYNKNKRNNEEHLQRMQLLKEKIDNTEIEQRNLEAVNRKIESGDPLTVHTLLQTRMKGITTTEKTTNET